MKKSKKLRHRAIKNQLKKNKKKASKLNNKIPFSKMI